MKRNERPIDEKTNSKPWEVVWEYLPDTLINLTSATLIWLFGVLVYLPAASEIGLTGLGLLCSLIILLSFLFFLFKALKDMPRLLESTSTILAFKWLAIRKKKVVEKDVERSRNWILRGLYILSVVIGLLLLSPLLSGISLSLTGLAVITALLLITWFVLI